MVKPRGKRRTARSKAEQAAEKQETMGTTKKTKDDKLELETVRSMAKTTPWDVRSEVFKNVGVGSAIIKDRLEDFDDADAKTVITSKTFHGLNIRKKDKRIIKQSLFKEKIKLIQAAKESMKAKKKREKTVITGDMRPLVDSLPTLIPSVEQYVAGSTKRPPSKSETPAPKKKNTGKQHRKQQLEDINIFQQVLKHPAYQSNPNSVIQEHLTNKIKLEASMDTSS